MSSRRNDSHTPPFLLTLLLGVGDDAARPGDGAVTGVVEPADGHLDLVAQLLAQTLQRVRRDVEAERLLLVPEQRRLVVLALRHRGRLMASPSSGATMSKRPPWPWAASLRRRSPSAIADGSASSMPRRGSPVLSKAPLRMSASSTRLLAICESTRAQKS